MQNELLVAIQGNNEDLLKYLHRYEKGLKSLSEFRADLDNLLSLQREECAERAIATEEPDYRGGSWLSVDKESIINANILKK